MSSARNKGQRRRFGSSGETSSEYALIAVPFFLIVFAVTDIGRYFLTVDSVRTLSSELARGTMTYRATSSLTSVCSLPSSGTPSVATAESTVPFLASGNIASATASRSPADSAGVATITASASYSFTFFIANWAGLAPTITSRTILKVY